MEISDLTADVAQEIPRTYRDLLKAANLSRDEIRELHRIRNARALRDFFGVLATAAAVPWLYAAFPNPLVGLFCILLTIHNFIGIAQVVHACGHGKFLSNRPWNDIVGSLAAAFLGFALAGHALAHQFHHTKLNTEGDSDQVWGRPEQSTREIFRMWLQDIFMISAVKRLLQYMQSDRKTFTVTPWRNLTLGFFTGKIAQILPIVGVQVAMIAYYWAIVGPQFYVYFYVLPILTLYPAVIRLRTACEHSFEAGYVPRTVEERWVSRSIRTNLFERFVVAPLLIEYHFEHHLLPGVPHYNLPLARRLLEAKGLEVPMAPGYFAFVFRRWREERAAAGAGQAA